MAKTNRRRKRGTSDAAYQHWIIFWEAKGVSRSRLEEYAALRRQFKPRSLHDFILTEGSKEQKKHIHLRYQGDTSMVTPAALKKRSMLKQDPGIQECIQRLWEAIPKGQNEGIPKITYEAMYERMFSLLFPDKDKDKDFKKDFDLCLESDWHRDSRGQEELTFEQFQDSMFEWVDTWCDSIDSDEYVWMLGKAYAHIFKTPIQASPRIENAVNGRAEGMEKFNFPESSAKKSLIHATSFKLDSMAKKSEIVEEPSNSFGPADQYLLTSKMNGDPVKYPLKAAFSDGFEIVCDTFDASTLHRPSFRRGYSRGQSIATITDGDNSKMSRSQSVQSLATDAGTPHLPSLQTPADRSQAGTPTSNRHSHMGALSEALRLYFRACLTGNSATTRTKAMAARQTSDVLNMIITCFAAGLGMSSFQIGMKYFEEWMPQEYVKRAKAEFTVSQRSLSVAVSERSNSAVLGAVPSTTTTSEVGEEGKKPKKNKRKKSRAVPRKSVPEREPELIANLYSGPSGGGAKAVDRDPIVCLQQKIPNRAERLLQSLKWILGIHSSVIGDSYTGVVNQRPTLLQTVLKGQATAELPPEFLDTVRQNLYDFLTIDDADILSKAEDNAVKALSAGSQGSVLLSQWIPKSKVNVYRTVEKIVESLRYAIQQDQASPKSPLSGRTAKISSTLREEIYKTHFKGLSRFREQWDAMERSLGPQSVDVDDREALFRLLLDVPERSLFAEVLYRILSHPAGCQAGIIMGTPRMLKEILRAKFFSRVPHFVEMWDKFEKELKLEPQTIYFKDSLLSDIGTRKSLSTECLIFAEVIRNALEQGSSVLRSIFGTSEMVRDTIYQKYFKGVSNFGLAWTRLENELGINPSSFLTGESLLARLCDGLTDDRSPLYKVLLKLLESPTTPEMQGTPALVKEFIQQNLNHNDHEFPAVWSHILREMNLNERDLLDTNSIVTKLQLLRNNSHVRKSMGEELLKLFSSTGHNNDVTVPALFGSSSMLRETIHKKHFVGVRHFEEMWTSLEKALDLKSHSVMDTNKLQSLLNESTLVESTQLLAESIKNVLAEEDPGSQTIAGTSHMVRDILQKRYFNGVSLFAEMWAKLELEIGIPRDRLVSVDDLRSLLRPERCHSALSRSIQLALKDRGNDPNSIPSFIGNMSMIGEILKEKYFKDISEFLPVWDALRRVLRADPNKVYDDDLFLAWLKSSSVPDQYKGIYDALVRLVQDPSPEAVRAMEEQIILSQSPNPESFVETPSPRYPTTPRSDARSDTTLRKVTIWDQLVDDKTSPLQWWDQQSPPQKLQTYSDLEGDHLGILEELNEFIPIKVQGPNRVGASVFSGGSKLVGVASCCIGLTIPRMTREECAKFVPPTRPRPPKLPSCRKGITITVYGESRAELLPLMGAMPVSIIAPSS